MFIELNRALNNTRILLRVDRIQDVYVNDEGLTTITTFDGNAVRVLESYVLVREKLTHNREDTLKHVVVNLHKNASDADAEELAALTGLSVQTIQNLLGELHEGQETKSRSQAPDPVA